MELQQQLLALTQQLSHMEGQLGSMGQAAAAREARIAELEGKLQGLGQLRAHAQPPQPTCARLSDSPASVHLVQDIVREPQRAFSVVLVIQPESEGSVPKSRMLSADPSRAVP